MLYFLVRLQGKLEIGHSWSERVQEKKNQATTLTLTTIQLLYIGHPPKKRLLTAATLYPDSWKVGRKNSWRVLTWSTEIDKIFSLNTRNFDQCVRTAEQGPVNSSGLTRMERNGYVLLYGLMKLPGPTNLSTGARGNFDCRQKELQDSPRVVHKMILAFLLHLFQAQV